MVSKAHVLSARSPDLRDIITRQASGVPVGDTNGPFSQGVRFHKLDLRNKDICDSFSSTEGLARQTAKHG